MNLTFQELRNANTSRCGAAFHPIDTWSPSDWATAMAGECGEACNFIKKLRRLDDADSSEDTPERRQEIIAAVGKELADVVTYVDLLAARLGIDLGTEVIAKFNEVSRKRGSDIMLGPWVQERAGKKQIENIHPDGQCMTVGEALSQIRKGKVHPSAE